MRQLLSMGHARLYAALTIMGVGGTLAGWQLWPVLFPREPFGAAEQLPDSPAEQALGAGLLDTRTASPELAAEAVEVARARLRALLEADAPEFGSGARRDDLVVAFVERLEATINADYERDIAALLARGRAPVPSPPSKQFMDKWTVAKGWTRGASVGVSKLEVRVILRAGRPIAPSAADEGYETTTLVQRDASGAHVFGLPDDPSRAGLDVVEVRLPMAIRPVRGEDRGAVLVGYQFAWKGRRGQWVPLAKVLYKGSGASYAGLGF